MNNSVNKKIKKEKKTGKFNFIDLTLVIILILAIAALFYVFSPVSKIQDLIATKEKTIEYTVLISDVDKDSLEKLDEGVALIDSVTKNKIGTVKDIGSVQHIEYTPVKDGDTYTMKTIEYPDRYDVTITVRATASYIEGRGYTVESTRIAIGEKMNIKFPNYVCSGYCESISVF